MAKQVDRPAQSRNKKKKVQFIVSREFAGSQTMQEALSRGRPVSGSRNGRNGRPAKGRKPEKNRESCRKQLNKWRGHGIIMVSCPCS